MLEPPERDEFAIENDQFTERFRRRISRSEYGLPPGTVRKYLTHLKHIVKMEVIRESSFRAVDWLREEHSPRFRKLRFVKWYKCDGLNTRHLVAAWKLLYEWVKETHRPVNYYAELQGMLEPLRRYEKKAKTGGKRCFNESSSDSDPPSNREPQPRAGPSTDKQSKQRLDANEESGKDSSTSTELFPYVPSDYHDDSDIGLVNEVLCSKYDRQAEEVDGLPAASRASSESPRREISCSLCSQKYKNRKSLIRHVRNNHKDAPNQVELCRSVPKSPPRACPFCGKHRGNLYQHKKSCPSRTTVPEEPRAGPSREENLPAVTAEHAVKQEIKEELDANERAAIDFITSTEFNRSDDWDALCANAKNRYDAYDREVALRSI